MISITLNGALIPITEAGGLQTATLTSREDNGIQTRQLSSLVRFTGSAFDILKAQLIDSPTSITNIVIAKITDDCCEGYLFNGMITKDGIKWCSGQCYIDAKVLEDNTQFICFKSTAIGDNWNGILDKTTHPQVTYCNELRPNWLMHILLILVILENIALAIFLPVVAVISVIVSVVCFIINLPFIPGTCPDDLSNGILDDYIGWMNAMNEAVVGCGRKHPSPLLRDYIKNVCDKCGLSFQSTILNDASSEYYNTVYFFPQIKKGCKTCNTPISDNVPVKTLEGVFTDLNPVFAAKYSLTGTTLRFERRDKLQLTSVAFDFTGADKSKLVTPICYEWNGEKKPAYMKCEYSMDGIDLVGSESLKLYNDIIEFNDPINKAFTGELSKVFIFGSARFRNDGIEEDVLNNYKDIPYLGSFITPYQNSLLLQNNTTVFPKLMIWDFVNNCVKIYPTPSGYTDSYPQSEVNIPYRLFNYPFFVDADFNDAQKNLYEYQKIEDPRTSTKKNINVDLTFRYNCGDLEKLALWSGFVTDQGTAGITEYVIDFYKHQVKLKGVL